MNFNRVGIAAAGQSPCYQCEDRKAGCACGCQAFAEWREMKRAAVRKAWAEESKNALVDTYRHENHKRQKKRRRGRYD